MAEPDGTGQAPLRVWRRSTGPAAAPIEEQRLFCGGRERTVDEVFEEMRARKREKDAERERQKAERARSDRKKKDEDEEVAAERRRNDRYAVKLLRQDTTAWGDGPSLSGTLG